MIARASIVRLIRLVPWLCAGVGVIWLIVHQWPLSGTRTFAFIFDGTSPWFDAFLPAERVVIPKKWEDGWVGERILMDPVYASLRVPGVYDRVRVLMETRFWKQPLMELGMLRDPNTFSFEMVPVWSEALSRGWREVTQGSMHGYVRDDLPDQTLLTAGIEKTLVWHATTTPIRAMDRGGTLKTYEVSLRGGHEFSVIPVSGEIAFTLAFQDMNRRSGENTIGLRVSRDGETFWTNTIQTGGVQDTKSTAVFDKMIRLTDLEPGVYRLSVVMGDDIFLRRIKTNAIHWVVGPRLSLGDTVGYKDLYPSVPIWTNSQHLAVDTFHREGLQSVRFGSAHAEIEQTHQAYPLDRLPQERDKPLAIQVPRGDLRVIGDAFFAFSPQALFLPSPRRLTDASDPIGEGITAVVTPYVQPKRSKDGWWRVNVDFWLHPKDNRPKLAISAPGMRSREGSIDIRFAELIYSRSLPSLRSWVRMVKQDFIATWNRLLPR